MTFLSLIDFLDQCAWTETGNVTEKTCMDELEPLSISLCPFYLPREFGHVIVTALYIPPSANITRASQTIYQCIEKLQTASPGTPKIILGDFNICKLDSVLPTFEQYLSCYTRGEKQLDLCYGNIKEAYRSPQKPSVGTSGHFAV